MGASYRACNLSGPNVSAPVQLLEGSFPVGGRFSRRKTRHVSLVASLIDGLSRSARYHSYQCLLGLAPSFLFPPLGRSVDVPPASMSDARSFPLTLPKQPAALRESLPQAQSTVWKRTYSSEPRGHEGSQLLRESQLSTDQPVGFEGHHPQN